MKSKLRFDFDYSDNRPIIYAQISTSDDVRDKVAKKFLEGFQHNGNLVSVFFNPSEANQDKSVQFYSHGGDKEGLKELLKLSADYIIENMIEACKETLSERLVERKNLENS